MLPGAALAASGPPVGLFVVLGIVLLLLVWAVGTYNGLVRIRNHCAESWADVDTELKRRYDLIPNLVNTVKGYATHEREVFERVVEARNRARANEGTPAAQARDENEMVRAVRQLFAVAESYPELKASEHFLALQQELTTTENRIQRARRFYNANVRDLANRIQVFPSNLLARLYGFHEREYFEIEDSTQRMTPQVDLAD